MQKKQVAILDFGSGEITAVIGERGINKTFIIKGRYSFKYDGYENGLFFNIESVKGAIFSAVQSILSASHNSINCVYVGVPASFTQIVVKDSQISFAKKKKIKEEDVDLLFDGAFMLQSQKQTIINRSAVVYEIDDSRRLANPIGVSSEILKGKLSFILCDNYFIDVVVPTVKQAGIPHVECVSTSLAQALYLVDAETRDRTSLILDVGYISSSIVVVRGDGILYQHEFPYGSGYISAALCERFEIDFDKAQELKKKVNLCVENSLGLHDLLEIGNGGYFATNEVKETVLLSLDSLCETVSDCLTEINGLLPDYVPILLTGGGITGLRGAKEHVAGRLNMSISVIAPSVPLMDKPYESSVLSLLDIALEQE